MKQHILSLGASLRPHVKTTKSLEVARLFFDGDVGPITVSTLREAEYFFEGGFKDILYAVGIVPNKLGRVKALIDQGADIKLILDDRGVANILAEYGGRNEVVFDVLIEIDSDMHRAGLSPDDPAVPALARLIDNDAHLNFMGFMTHAGESYNCVTQEEIRKHSHLERDAVVRSAEYILEDGIEAKIMSVGSSPTAICADDLTGINEVRAGVFMFQDLFQAGLGVCKREDIALTVLTTVTGHKKNQNRVIIDAGGLALSKDRGTAGQKIDRQYGLVCHAEDGVVIEDLIVEGANQEHGLITSLSGAPVDFAKYPIGSLLRILPNHACMTAAAHDHYYVVEGDLRVVDVWNRCSGW